MSVNVSQTATGTAVLLLAVGLAFMGIARIYRANQRVDNQCDDSGNDWRWASMTAIILLIGWSSAGYGVFLVLTGVWVDRP